MLRKLAQVTDLGHAAHNCRARRHHLSHKNRDSRENRDQSKYHARPRTEVLESEQDRKSTRLNSSHVRISYAVFCLKKKYVTPAASDCLQLLTHDINHPILL